MLTPLPVLIRAVTRSRPLPRGLGLPAAASFVLLVWLLLPTLAAAQEESDQPNSQSADVTGVPVDEPVAEEELEDIDLLELEIPTVVTATRREQKITAVPYAVSVITAEDIRRSGARWIPDALRLVPGVDVAELSFGQAAVSPRGFHGLLSRRVLVLVDGRQIYDSLFGGTAWSSWPFQLEDIERIEVIRGPAGVTWGANAVNGVINIITKDPADQLGLTVTAGGGSRGTHKEHLGYAFSDGKLRLRLSGEFEGSDGFRQGGSIWRDLEDDYKGGRSGLHAIYEAGPNDTVTISAGNALVDGGYPPTPMAGIGLRRNSGTQASFLMGKWDHTVNPGNQFEIMGYINDFQVSPGFRAIDYRYQQLGINIGHTFKPADRHTLAWGIDSRVDLLDGTNSDPILMTRRYVKSTTIGLYLQDEWQLAPKWTLSLGGRVDYDSYGGFEPSARGALAYALSDSSSMYAAISRAFQMTPTGANFLNISLANGWARVTNSDNIRPEVLIAYELGYRGKFFDRLETNVNLFLHEYNDLTTITPMLGPPGLVRLDFDNRAKGTMYGVELDAEFAATKDLTLLGNYTFQRFDWEGTVPRNDSDDMSPPKHKFMLGARYAATDDLHLSSHLYYVDDVWVPNPGDALFFRHVGPYMRLDVQAEHELWDDRASIAVGVRNLLDAGHYEGGSRFINDAQVPRMVYAELRLRIK